MIAEKNGLGLLSKRDLNSRIGGGGTLHWVPQARLGECILGLIQRTKAHGYHKPPTEGGGEIVGDEWQGSYVLIDPTHHTEGQRVAVENDVVGKPRALLKSLVDHLNARPDAPYQIEAEPLFDGSKFWAFAQKHDNVLKRIMFDFVVPNMWGTESDLEKDLKETGNQTGAERVVVTMTGQHGISTKNSKIENGVDYVERGAGTLTATAPDGSRFSSTQRPVTTKIPALQASVDAVQSYFGDLRRRILGREQDNSTSDPDRNGRSSSID